MIPAEVFINGAYLPVIFTCKCRFVCSLPGRGCEMMLYFFMIGAYHAKVVTILFYFLCIYVFFYSFSVLNIASVSLAFVFQSFCGFVP